MKTMVKTRPAIISVITGTKENEIAKSTLTFANGGDNSPTTEYYTMNDELYKIYLERCYGINNAKKIFNG